MSRYTRLLNADHDTTSNNNNSNEATTDNTPPSLSSFPTNQMSNMLNSLKESATNASSSVRTGLGLPPSSNNSNDNNSDLESQASNMLDEVSEYCPKMTYQQRVMGFGICFTCGYLMTFASFRLFIKLVEGNPAPFVFLYTSGNIMSLLSSMFLSGPKRQFKSMFDEKRRTTSITYLISLGTSIIVCFIPIPTGPKIGLLVLLLLVQMMASLWYTLSYIPYGRATAKKMILSVVNGSD